MGLVTELPLQPGIGQTPSHSTRIDFWSPIGPKTRSLRSLQDPERVLVEGWPVNPLLQLLLYATHQRAHVRFAEVESVATISMLLLRYKVSVNTNKFKDGAPGETPLERRYRLMKATPIVTLTPQGIPLTFTRR